MDEKKSKTAHFLKNRDDWIRAVINDPGVSHTTARVAVHIAMRLRGDQRFCWPSIDTIAKDTGVSRRAVSMALDVLCDEDRRFVFRESRPNVGNMYSLNFPWL